MHANDVQQLGTAISNSHASLRDDYQVSCPEVDQLVEIARGCKGVLGSRVMGAGFGGCTISLVKKTDLDQTVRTLRTEYGQLLGRPVWTHVVRPTHAVQSVAISDAAPRRRTVGQP